MGMRKSKKAVSPVVATIILIAVFIAVVAAALSFATVELSSYYAQSDFNQSQNFVLSLAESLENVGFTFGRSVSIGYAFKYASVALIPVAIQYSVTLTFVSGSPITLSTYTGFVLVAISGHYYSLGSNFYSIVYPPSYKSLSSFGGSGSMGFAFMREYQTGGKGGGVFLDSVVVPIPLSLNLTLTSSIGSQSTTQYITRIYLLQLSYYKTPLPLPTNCATQNPPTQKVVKFNLTSGFLSLQGGSQTVCSYSGVKSVQISVQGVPPYSQFYPVGSNSFFVFPSTLTTLNCPSKACSGSTSSWQVQVFIGDVGVNGS
ncbi:hypothetical protein B9Q02_09655 [Candidatus Marsarchaeota G1 archaeon BE_D]|jgi:flagellin-like protein|uniref:Uncharacterized protein n=1 Tax=Candidatus Marsarchaeota G1 archaeon BE_D TaxID=1978156 RepID=A0A2R6AD72_9ARCH|nr:MAG: hypothetical protein B9Q02_09655 [Candidatus Marsarchaeota G1 archaeon BE_D]